MNDERLAQIFRTPDALMLLEVFAIVAGSALLVWLVQTALPWLASRLFGRYRLFVLALVPLLRLLIIIVAFLLIVPLVIDPSWQNMLALLGSVGLAVGFALKDYASSLIAGVVSVAETPYRNGDWVTVNGHYGEVVDVGMRNVRLRTPGDSLVAVPHLKLWTDPVVNASNGHPSLQCQADFYLQPAHDAAEARCVLEDVVLTSPYLHPEQPFVVLAREQPWGTRLRIRAYPIEARQQFEFVTDLTVRGKAALLARGLRFATAPAMSGRGADTGG